MCYLVRGSSCDLHCSFIDVATYTYLIAYSWIIPLVGRNLQYPLYCTLNLNVEKLFRAQQISSINNYLSKTRWGVGVGPSGATVTRLLPTAGTPYGGGKPVPSFSKQQGLREITLTASFMAISSFHGKSIKDGKIFTIYKGRYLRKSAATYLGHPLFMGFAANSWHVIISLRYLSPPP